MGIASRTHLVLIPSYNPGALVYATVRAARAAWNPVWVVVDGSTDGTAQGLLEMAAADPGLRVLLRTRNGGKGAAVLDGLRMAAREGYTHALTMDSDGQHPAASIGEFMARSQAQPQCMILGVPQFSAEAPALRVRGRRVSNWWVNLETWGSGVKDSLFGFRVYPIGALRAVMEGHHGMRRFDFDPEAAVRLCWAGVRLINVPAPVRYIDRAAGGVSHFRYLRDNALLTWMHLRLMTEFVLRLPFMLLRR